MARNKFTDEIRLDDRGELDEVVAGRFARPRHKSGSVCVHIERMSPSSWWMRIDLPRGKNIVVNFWAEKGRKVHARAERDA